MKKVIFLLIGLFVLVSGARAQQEKKLSFATTLGVGIAMNTPASTPFSWQVMGYYHIGKRFSLGVGSGLAFYEKTLIPLFADVRFSLTKPRKFTPYLACSAGYGFASAKDVNGGLYLNPSIGVEWIIRSTRKLFLGVGYEVQKLERLKRAAEPLFTAEFVEKLNHNSVSVKIGFMF